MTYAPFAWYNNFWLLRDYLASWFYLCGEREGGLSRLLSEMKFEAHRVL